MPIPGALGMAIAAAFGRFQSILALINTDLGVVLKKSTLVDLGISSLVGSIFLTSADPRSNLDTSYFLS